jgi:hypothetical protein
MITLLFKLWYSWREWRWESSQLYCPSHKEKTRFERL